VRYEKVLEDGADPTPKPFHTSGVQLKHQIVSVSIANETGEQIPLSMDHSASSCFFREDRLAEGCCAPDALPEKGFVDLNTRVGEQPYRDLGTGIIVTPAYKFTSVGIEVHNLSSIYDSLHPLYSPGEDPGMPVGRRFLPPFFKEDLSHVTGIPFTP
jgi:hypothetical protein